MIVESRSLAPPARTLALPPLGLEANCKGLEMAIDWSYEKMKVPRRLEFDELFDETTALLNVY